MEADYEKRLLFAWERCMSEDVTKLIVRAVMSLGLMTAGLFILIASPVDNQALEQAATGWVGLVIGYWLR